MNALASPAAIIDRVKRNLVGLKMPRALEILDVTLRGIERGETTALDALDILLTEEQTLRENRRVRMALQMARLSAVKTLAGFNSSFQPSLDRNRIMALAELQFIDRAEAVHRLREHADLLPEHVRTKANIQSAPIPPTLRRRGRPPKNADADHVQG